MEVNGNKGNDVITLAASGFTGTVYGVQGDDTITAAAVTTAAAGALGATATGVTISGDINDNLTGSNGVTPLLVATVWHIDGNTGADVITGGAGAIPSLTLETLCTAASSTGFKTFSDFAATTTAATSDVQNVGADTVPPLLPSFRQCW